MWRNTAAGREVADKERKASHISNTPAYTYVSSGRQSAAVQSYM
jgi:hypothetical protein